MKLLDFKRKLWIVGIGLIGAVGWSSGALAHNALTSSEPADGAVFDTAVPTWTLTFSGEVPLESASAEIVAADGTRLALPPPVHGSTTSSIVFALPDSLSGDITGRWRLVGSDGHVISGRVQFTISLAPSDIPDVSEAPSESTESIPGDATPTTEVVADEILGDANSEQISPPSFVDPAPESVRWVLQILSYLGLVVVGGLVFADMVLARGILRRPRVTLALQVGSLALFVAPAVSGLIHIADITGVSFGSSFRHLGSIVDTTAGSMLAVRTLIGFVILMVTLTLDQRPLDSRFVRGLAALVTLHIVTVPFTGHARSMRWPALGVPADMVHLLGVTVWVGGLLALVAFVMPAAHSEHAVTAYLRFSRFASGAVAAIVVTGVIQTARLHDRPLAILDSWHGILLVVKVVLVAGMLGVGWWSRRLLGGHRDFVDSDARSQLIRVTSVEAACGVFVVGVSAALVRATFSV